MTWAWTEGPLSAPTLYRMDPEPHFRTSREGAWTLSAGMTCILSPLPVRVWGVEGGNQTLPPSSQAD